MENSSTASLKLELEDVLELIQCSTDVAKEEARRDAAGKWRAAKVQNEECRWQGLVDQMLEAVAVPGHLEVGTRV